MADPATPAEQEPEHIKDLRKKADNEAKATAENELLRKELAFTKAGIDTSSEPAQALLSSYDGELTNEAIVEKATKWNLAPAAAATPAPAPADPPPAAGLGSESLEAQHQQAAGALSGTPAPVPDPPTKDGDVEALDRFKENRANGMSMTKATDIAFGDVIRAGMEGRPGARFDRDQWEADAAKVGHGARFAR